MKPQSFALLSLTAAASLAAALFVYSTTTPWSRQVETGAPLFPGLAEKAAEVAEIQVSNAGRNAIVAKSGDQWVLKTRDGYPVMPETVRSLLKNAGEARLVAPKTRNPDRYGDLDLEDPSAKNAKSSVLMMLDAKGNVLAEAILGKVRPDAFGAGKDGTYIRKPKEPLTWLANTPMAPGISMRDWVDTRLVDTETDKIKRVVIEVAGEEPIELVSDGRNPRGFVMSKMPEGLKLKYTNALDTIVETASHIEFDDLRKAPQGGAMGGDAVTIETDDGFKTVLKLRKDGADSWATATVTGEGNGKAEADEVMKRLSGWELRLPAGKAEQVLKKRADILEKPGNETTSGGGKSFFEEQGGAPGAAGPPPGGLGPLPGGIGKP